VSEREVEIVVFDAGLTLVHAQPSFVHVFVTGLKRAGLGIDVDDLDSWGEAFHVAWRSHGDAWQEAGEISPHVGDLEVEQRFWRGLYRKVLHELGVEGDHPEIARHVHEAFLEPDAWGPYPEATHVLDGLAEAGIRVALLSNWSPHLREILDAHDLTRRFEAVVISGEIGIAKPDLSIFDRMIEALGELPGPQIAYVGDDLEHDIEPSRELGLRAVLVDRRGVFDDHDGPRVDDLRQLPEVLPLARPVTLW
jgi:HAD superfamily hydrolase (TIGR01549 family)